MTAPGKRGPHLYGRARRFEPQWMAPFLREVGRRLRDMRLEEGVAVSELAAATGIHPSAIYRIERGQLGRRGAASTGPTLSTLIRLAVALSHSPCELMP